jgi:hypothetical protein
MDKSMLFSRILKIAELGADYGSLREAFEPIDHQTQSRINDYNDLMGREGNRGKTPGILR